MSGLITKINDLREQEIMKHYLAFQAELNLKIKAEPLRDNFDIYTGCVSKEITEEIVKRLQKENIIANVRSTGIFFVNYYVNVQIILPKYLERDM